MLECFLKLEVFLVFSKPNRTLTIQKVRYLCCCLILGTVTYAVLGDAYNQPTQSLRYEDVLGFLFHEERNCT